jgi:multiple antibiotic resistance protein
VNAASFIAMTVSLFAITAPIAVLPIFVAATAGQSGPQQRRTAVISAVTYICAGFAALVAGNAILGFFGVSVASLRVVGMTVIAVIGWRMLNAPTPVKKHNKAESGAEGTGDAPPPSGKENVETHLHHTASNTKVIVAEPTGPISAPDPLDIGIMPLGFPIYAGPGVLSVIIGWGSSGSAQSYAAALVAITINAVVILFLDFLATPITRLIGAEGLLVTEKLFGLVVVAIAVGGMASALITLFPGLARGVH